MAFIVMIGHFVLNEAGYNNSIEDVDSIYRLVNVKDNNYNIDYRLRDEIQNKIPGIKETCLLNHISTDVNYKGKVFQLNDVLIVDQDFFRLFGLTFLYGDGKNPMPTANDVVITESAAKRIFGKTDVVGEFIKVNHQFEVLVKAVVKDLPNNLSFNAELFASFENSPKQRLTYKQNCLTYNGKDDSQCNYPFNLFVKLDKTADVKNIDNQISAIHKLNEFRYPEKVNLVPMSSNYFNTGISDSDLLHGNVDLVEILSVIGIIILLLAVINFVNLTTASYKYRLTEISVKKCFGADRKRLILQLIAESYFTCLVSGILSLIIAEFLLPYFSIIVGKNIGLMIFKNIEYLFLFFVFLLVLGSFTGFVPSLVLSKISPVQLFRKNLFAKSKSKNPRGILTVFQFAVTIILISSLIIISNQINYVKHKDLGFNKENLIYLKVHYTMAESENILKSRLLQFHNVISICGSQGIPGEIHMWTGGFVSLPVDPGALKTFGFKIIKGRNLRPDDLNKACLINEAAYKKMQEGEFPENKVNGSEVVGVVSNFNYASMYNKTEPLALFYNTWGISHISIRYKGSTKEMINYIKEIWDEISPDYPLEFGFYNEYFASMYKKEENLATVVSLFSMLAVIISCMGIFGLSVFQAEQKIKEIGIRKVLGASVSSILKLLSFEFVKWVIIANIVAWPVSYYLMENWLQSFAYRINIGWLTFLFSGGIALLISVITVSFQAVKAAVANPVESLRYE